MYAYPIYLIVFGFGLTGILGLFACWLDRKVTARVQYRVGPPLLQPIIDIVKLLGKETLIPTGAYKPLFMAAPLISFTGVVVVSTLLWVTVFRPQAMFTGDIIVVIYLLAVPSLGIILGGFASGNPLAALGASREMKLVLAYELTFVIALLVPVILSEYSLTLPAIALHQQETGAFVFRPSGLVAFVVVLLCSQAKIALVPFDVAEAETELASGLLIEYAGPALALYRLSKNMLFATLPLFLILMFLGGISLEGLGLLWAALKLIGIVAIITVIRNTNPRVRIDQALRFFWGPVTLIAMVAVALALYGW
ncbi:MAG: complex I subunit 1 family protein [Candidatus Hydrogenedentota bacterium]